MRSTSPSRSSTGNAPAGASNSTHSYGIRASVTSLRATPVAGASPTSEDEVGSWRRPSTAATFYGVARGGRNPEQSRSARPIRSSSSTQYRFCSTTYRLAVLGRLRTGQATWTRSATSSCSRLEFRRSSAESSGKPGCQTSAAASAAPVRSRRPAEGAREARSPGAKQAAIAVLVLRGDGAHQRAPDRALHAGKSRPGSSPASGRRTARR